MVTKKTGLSRDLIIHPGETIAALLEERGMTQAELAVRAGVSAAFVSSVIAGKKNISSEFAFALEYVFGVPKTFWMNLQSHYEAELLDFEEIQTVTEEEKAARRDLSDVVKYLRRAGKIPVGESLVDSILSLRRFLGVRSLISLKGIVPNGVFRMAEATVNPYVLGAWIRMCQLAESETTPDCRLSAQAKSEATQDCKLSRQNADSLVRELKTVMLDENADIRQDIRLVMSRYGIDFSVVQNFRGAPVQGYLSRKKDGTYQMALTIRGSYADIFWFSLFHEIGHIVNGDLGKTSSYVDGGMDEKQERAADRFASEKLLNPRDYDAFVKKNNFSIESIKEFADTQNVMPFIVIGRLQKEKRLDYAYYSRYKIRYKWHEA